MDENTNPNRELGEDPKAVFRRLPRPADKPIHKGEDPKEFLRRMSARRRAAANPGPGQEIASDAP
jgi:hypothetical protein